MKYSKEIENILKKAPSTWTMEEAENIARTIQRNPYDDELKNIFLNLNPANGENCNTILYVSLEKLHSYMIREYQSQYTLDEYIESVSYFIYQRSLIDWRPGDSLMGYIKFSSLPNGPIGHDIRSQYYLLSHKMSKQSKTYSKLIPELSEEHEYEDAEFLVMLKTICGMTSITMAELEVILLAGNDRLSDEDLESINSILGTDYDKKKIYQIRDNFHKKVKRYYKKLKKLLLP